MESLDATDMYEYDRMFKEFQTYGDTVREAFNNLFEQVKNNPQDQNLYNLLAYINDRLVPEDIQEGYSKNPLVQEYIDENKNNIYKASRSTKSRIYKINAEYNGRLLAIESQSKEEKKSEPKPEMSEKAKNVALAIKAKKGLRKSKPFDTNESDFMPIEFEDGIDTQSPFNITPSETVRKQAYQFINELPRQVRAPFKQNLKKDFKVKCE